MKQMRNPEQAFHRLQYLSKLFKKEVLYYEQALTIRIQIDGNRPKEKAHNKVNKRKAYWKRVYK